MSNKDFKALAKEAGEWRKILHTHPQTAYEETFISDFVAEKLESWGVAHHRGLAVTGVVATIEGKTNTSGRTIGLRADMDALDIHEQTNLPYASKNQGKMHACGHDGHTTMLLAAAKHLSENNDFDGTVHLIFQPAEEGTKGADRMVEEGLFDQFPMEQVYAIHNWPWIPKGKVGMRVGGIMAGVDHFKVKLTGKGSHAAVPQDSIDPAVIVAQIIMGLQTIVSRNIAPTDPAVVSVTNIHIGTGAFNIIGEGATMEGTARYYSMEAQAMIQKRFIEIVKNTAETYGATVEIDYETTSIPTINTEAETALCAEAAASILGQDNVDTNTEPYMTGEDFGAMLREKPGCYIYMGQGEPDHVDSPHNQPLHSPFYDFNNDIIEIGVAYWDALVQKILPAA